MKDLASRLVVARKKKGLSQTELAQRISSTPQAVSGWERSITNPSGNLLIKLCRELGVNKTWMLFGEESVDNGFVELPFYNEVFASAGNGCFVDDEKHEFYSLPESVISNQCNSKDLFCIKIQGDSMEPVLYNGSIIAVDPSCREIIDGRMFLIKTEFGLRVKVLKLSLGKVLVISYNQSYDDEWITSDDEFDILGIVFWYSSTFK